MTQVCAKLVGREPHSERTNRLYSAEEEVGARGPQATHVRSAVRSASLWWTRFQSDRIDRS